MPDTKQTVLEQAVADQWRVLPSGLTVLVRPMPGYSSTHVIFATKFGSIDRDFRLDGKEVHLPAPATCSPPPSSWTKAWMCCWAW